MKLPTRSEEAYEHLLGLRVVRAYTEDPIPEQEMEAILEAARWTGSSKNVQGWEFVVVTGDQLAALASAGNFTDPVRNSAATIALVRTPDGNAFDIGRVAQNIMLAAAARGIGSCAITLHHSDRAVEVLELPAGFSCTYAVSLGYPFVEGEKRIRQAGRTGRVGGRKPLDDLVHRQVHGG